MARGWVWGLLLVLPVAAATNEVRVAPLHGLTEVPSARVELRGGFWGPRLETQSAITLPHALRELEADGHVTNFDKAAGGYDGDLRGHHAFDSDLHKVLEGIYLSLQHQPNAHLRLRADSTIDRILAAQELDGFLISYFIVQQRERRWEDLRLEHQMYNAGHFFEMAVAHHELTGETRVLDAARRFADHIDGIFGPGKRYDVDGHQEVELALIKLYRATGERRYFELAKFFLEERGHAHGLARLPFDPATAVLPPKSTGPQTPEQRQAAFRARLRVRNGRMQDHKPVADQHEAVGHAVRAGYMYSAMTDVLRFGEAPGYASALNDLWHDVVGRKMYVTGGIGTGQYGDEGFGDPYRLPNESAYCESCAAIAHVLWEHRMNLHQARAEFADVMELALYNAALAGIGLEGDTFCYENPLASKGGGRSSWIGLACCPANLSRLLPQIGGFVYAQGPGQIYVNLYAAGEARIEPTPGVMVRLRQETDYPWNGRVRLTLAAGAPAAFSLCLRVPGWLREGPVPGGLYGYTDRTVQGPTLKLNGTNAPAQPEADGYIHVTRHWQSGDVVELELPMPLRRVHADPAVAADRGRVALMRGPLVYCFEAVDQSFALDQAALPSSAPLTSEHRPGLLGGVTVLKAPAKLPDGRPGELTAVPYYAWQNRQKGAMRVWVPEVKE